MAEITDTGYVLKTQNQWYEDEQQLYLDIDSDWDVDPSSPDGLKIAHDAEIFGNLDELGQAAYNSKDPGKANGVALESVCAITGVTRDQGSPSTVAIEISGVSGSLIVAGDEIASDDGSDARWTIDANATIPPSGTVASTATCTVNGATQADTGVITRIIDNRTGWFSVTNTSPATLGRGVQSNASLRAERDLTVGKSGENQIESLLGNVYAVDGVRQVAPYENTTNGPDSNGLPAHSICIITDGGTDADVARAIYDKLSTGVTQHSAGTSSTVSVQSLKYPTLSRNIVVNRPDYVDITVAVTVTQVGDLPGDIVQQIKDAIVSYSIGELFDDGDSGVGFNQTGIKIADDVAPSQLNTPVNYVIGQYGASYISALTLNGGSSPVAIAFDELARFSDGNITVTVV